MAVEIAAAVDSTKDSIVLNDGRSVGRSGADNIWTFEVDVEIAPLAETPGVLSAEA